LVKLYLLSARSLTWSSPIQPVKEKDTENTLHGKISKFVLLFPNGIQPDLEFYMKNSFLSFLMSQNSKHANETHEGRNPA